MGASTPIAESKMNDLNCFTTESAMKMVAGTHVVWAFLLKVQVLLKINSLKTQKSKNGKDIKETQRGFGKT